MKPLEVHTYEQRLQNVIQVAEGLQDFELKSHLAKYLCILLAGYIEIAIEEIFTEYARRQSSPQISRYVSKQLGWNLSLNMAKVIDILGDFDPGLAKWATDTFVGPIADALNSIKANRDNFSHGGTGGISLATAKNYHERARNFVEQLCDKVIPGN